MLSKLCDAHFLSHLTDLGIWTIREVTFLSCFTSRTEYRRVLHHFPLADCASFAGCSVRRQDRKYADTMLGYLGGLDGTYRRHPAKIRYPKPGLWADLSLQAVHPHRDDRQPRLREALFDIFLPCHSIRRIIPQGVLGKGFTTILL